MTGRCKTCPYICLFLPKDIYQILPVPATVVKIQKDYLLPTPKLQLMVSKWDSEGRANKGCPYMGIPVSVLPAGIVLVRDVLRNEPFHRPREVLYNPLFKLNGSYRRRRSGDEYSN